uniref:Mu-conotoxin GS n=2 Tax=Conus geographus TaxID=6491 RepID=U6GS_CONGE|nr:RecName: Full=Mu-conotoxin GS; Short=CGS [Conus geographus]
ACSGRGSRCPPQCCMGLRCGRGNPQKCIGAHEDV